MLMKRSGVVVSISGGGDLKCRQANRACRWWQVLDFSHSADIIKHVCSSKTDLFFVYGIELLSLAFKWRTWSPRARCYISYDVKYWIWNSALKGLYGEVSTNIWEFGRLWGVFNKSCLLGSCSWFSDVAKWEERESQDWMREWIGTLRQKVRNGRQLYPIPGSGISFCLKLGESFSYCGLWLLHLVKTSLGMGNRVSQESD